MQYHYVNENYEKGMINVLKIDSNDNIADIFTKALYKQKFKNFRNLFNVI